MRGQEVVKRERFERREKDSEQQKLAQRECDLARPRSGPPDLKESVSRNKSRDHDNAVRIASPRVRIHVATLVGARAGVAQWQSARFPPWIRGSDSRRPLSSAELATVVFRNENGRASAGT